MPGICDIDGSELYQRKDDVPGAPRPILGRSPAPLRGSTAGSPAFPTASDDSKKPLRELAELRLANPEVSLRELGELADPPLTKSAVYHRVRRIEELATEMLEDEMIARG